MSEKNGYSPISELDAYLNMDMLRLLTAGSVDDGKSTLIGRLLFDTKSIFEDQMEAIEKSSERRGDSYTNLALLTDGLKAEREQGITIDVAYKYFSTPKRKFIIADTPGHIQYTRNMVTGASTADLALILIDARKGVIEQTKRHTLIVSLLGIKQVAVCINKMDLVEYSQNTYESIKKDYINFASGFGLTDVHFIPIVALHGDNIVEPSSNMLWHKEGTLLQYLESAETDTFSRSENGRFPVQWVIRPQSDAYHDYRGYSGKVEGGSFKKGDRVTILPSGIITTITNIDSFEGELSVAESQISVTLRLADQVDIGRGDMIVSGKLPDIVQEIVADICWMDETRKLSTGSKYILRHTTNLVKCNIKEIEYRLDIISGEKIEGVSELSLNDIARIHIKTAKPIFTDKYSENRPTGAFILIDEASNATVAAGMIA